MVLEISLNEVINLWNRIYITPGKPTPIKSLVKCIRNLDETIEDPKLEKIYKPFLKQLKEFK